VRLELATPHALLLLLLLPLWAFWSYRQRHRKAVLKFSGAHVLARGRRGWRATGVKALPVMRAAALFLAIIALARPRESDARRKDLSVEGIDIVIALDLSTSMEAGDFRPNNRLFVAKEVLAEFVSSRVNDRIGLVVFAGAAYTQAPLTLDYGVVKNVVGQLRTRVLEDGTAIGDAIGTSVNRLRDSDTKSKVIVLITDGDNNSGRISPMDAAATAKSLRIPVFTILVGRGGKVPFPAGQDLWGNTAWREMEIPTNPQLLKDIAVTTGGEFYRATDRASLAEGLVKVLDKMERSKIMEGGAAANYRENFMPFLLAAFALAALELLLKSTLLRVFP
jgi:Ca-activated chloride channel family protein